MCARRTAEHGHECHQESQEGHQTGRWLLGGVQAEPLEVDLSTRPTQNGVTKEHSKNWTEKGYFHEDYISIHSRTNSPKA